MAVRLTTLVTNAAKVRRETLDGRSYLVAPVVMITPDVHAGNEGPVYYPEAVVKSSVAEWEGKPLTVYHPEINGEPVSASEPALEGKRTVGFIKNVAYNTSLTGDAWFDEEKTKTVDSRVTDALEAGQQIEVSTGMFGVTVDKKGTLNNASYAKEAVKIFPDHLAILPDKEGACSIKKGCGCNRINNEKPLTNEASLSTVMQNLRRAINDKLGAYVYIRDVYSKFFIYESDNGQKLYKRSYKSDSNGNVTVGPEDPTEVMWVQEYRTPEGTFIGNSSPKGDQMDKASKVTFLLNHYGWDEKDRDTLMGKPDDWVNSQYDKIKNKPITNTTPAPAPNPQNLTAEQIMNLLPASVRETLAIGERTRMEQRNGLITNIKANPNNRFTDEWLNTQPIEMLQGLSSLATVPAQAAPPSIVTNSIPVLVNQAGGHAQGPPILTPPSDISKKS